MIKFLAWHLSSLLLETVKFCLTGKYLLAATAAPESQPKAAAKWNEI
jgi:hypothetical protein